MGGGGVKGGIPSTLPAPWVRGDCDGGDGRGKADRPSPLWVLGWGEAARGGRPLRKVPSQLPPPGEDVRGGGESIPLIRPRVGTEVGEDGGPDVVASRSALPPKRGSSLPWGRGSSLPWGRGSGLAERVRRAIVGAGAGATWGVKKLGRIGEGETGGAPAVPTDIVSGGGGWEGRIGIG